MASSETVLLLGCATLLLGTMFLLAVAAQRRSRESPSVSGVRAPASQQLRVVSPPHHMAANSDYERMDVDDVAIHTGVGGGSIIDRVTFTCIHRGVRRWVCIWLCDARDGREAAKRGDIQVRRHVWRGSTSAMGGTGKPHWVDVHGGGEPALSATRPDDALRVAESDIDSVLRFTRFPSFTSVEIAPRLARAADVSAPVTDAGFAARLRFAHG